MRKRHKLLRKEETVVIYYKRQLIDLQNNLIIGKAELPQDINIDDPLRTYELVINLTGFKPYLSAGVLPLVNNVNLLELWTTSPITL